MSSRNPVCVLYKGRIDEKSNNVGRSFETWRPDFHGFSPRFTSAKPGTCDVYRAFSAFHSRAVTRLGPDLNIAGWLDELRGSTPILQLAGGAASAITLARGGANVAIVEAGLWRDPVDYPYSMYG